MADDKKVVEKVEAPKTIDNATVGELKIASWDLDLQIKNLSAQKQQVDNAIFSRAKK